MQSIIEYYGKKETLLEILNAVDQPGRRVWKVQYTDGTFQQNKKKINNMKKLRELLLGSLKIPDKVYVSVAKFMNPERVYGKKTKKTAWKIADALFLGSELLFDIDSESDLSIAHKEAIEVMKFMQKHQDYKLANIRYSGKKGFHLLYYDLNPIQEPNPLERLRLTEERRRQLLKNLPNLTTINPLHKDIIVDQFRVHAAIGTVKGSTGHKVLDISPVDFVSMKTNDLLEKYRKPLVRPIKPMIGDEISHLTSILGGKEKSRVISYPITYHFLDNTIKGTKGKVITVLKFSKETKHVIRKMLKIQREYKLGDLYVFNYRGIQMWISFKAIAKQRLDKIMRACNPINLNSYLHYGHTWIPISEAVDKDGEIVWEKPQLMGVYKSFARGEYSRPHCVLLGISYKYLIGKEKNNVCKAIISGG